ncbi:Sarcosine/dimethylglycine N-methyltransferase [Micromonospora sp. MW-13]|uniref:class I SAM-dependent methyltransferase n=1 Tax=Micromonospora sp. MW-13 TaxID=2094022 RepID=UPI000E445AE6|nr:class I SAM-dependent methyltransferase [Micromonospora sp. MW-13]RGC66621.1 Sarcosine/dimethylglycine N-methyltransferase [Micromonospora sp. MW-13]
MTADVGTEQFWEGHYRSRERVWSGQVNAALADVLTGLDADLPAGTALDLGCGEGADAVWLARRGWRVRAVDVSPTALARAAAHATEAGVGHLVEVARHDLESSFPDGRFDLVSAQYLQSPLDFARHRVLRLAAESVAPGGLLLIVEHASAPGHHVDHPRFPTPEETLTGLELAPGEWARHRVDAVRRTVPVPSGEIVTVTDSVIAMRRRGDPADIVVPTQHLVS